MTLISNPDFWTGAEPLKKLEKRESCVVVMSGGQDSATCLFWALARYELVHAITFDYGQKHAVELQAAEALVEFANGLEEAPRVKWQLVPLKSLKSISGDSSALTGDIPVEASGGHKNLPSTFVPGRNVIMLSLAGAYAVARGIPDIITGVCQTDYSGYPDCRRVTIDAVQEAMRLGNDLLPGEFSILTPLMDLTKAETWDLLAESGDYRHIEAVLTLSHTCYEGDRVHFNPWGFGCGTCPACELREKGFTEWREKHEAND